MRYVKFTVYCDCIINACFDEVAHSLLADDWAFLFIFLLIPLNSIEDAFNTNLIIAAATIYDAFKLNHLVFENNPIR